MLKDLYQILEIDPKATTEEVKKAFRKLAHQFHPDKNPENPFAEIHFRSIQEAYATLSHTQKRTDYDYERWLSGRFNKKTTLITPDYINNELIKLQDYLNTLDVYRMNKQLLHEYLLFVLSDEKQAILHLKATTAHIENISNNILQITQLLPEYYALPVIDRLLLLAEQHPYIRNSIETENKKRKQAYRWQKITPWLIAGAIGIILLFMFLYSTAVRN